MDGIYSTCSLNKGFIVSKKIALFSMVFLIGCSGGGASGPGDDDVKQALYEHYKSSSSNEDLKKGLAEMKLVGCEKEAHGFRCELSHPKSPKNDKLFFMQDKGTGKWELGRLDSYKN